jgi:hypothetical protein
MAMPQRFRAYHALAGGRGSVKSLAKNFARNGNAVSAGLAPIYQNRPRGYVCPSCAWATPVSPHTFEFCENGAKATAWELTHKRATPEFLAKHTPRLATHWESSTATG